jgi:predicted PurR-regulated permease PerM
MRAAFGFLVIVLVMGIGLWLAKQQSQTLTRPLPGTEQLGTAASAPAAQNLPKAVGAQVQGAIDEAARRASAEQE